MKLSRVHLALGVLCVLFLVWTIASGVRPGAYTDYLAEWRKVMAGHDPWRASGDTPLNAYGPLFNALGLLAWLDPIAPKLLFASGYVAFVTWLILRTAPDRSPRRTHAVIALCLLNPFPWVEIAHFGFFDVLVGIACVGAAHAVRRGSDRLSGALVGVGILVKFLPAVLLPVLASGGRRLRPNLVGAAVVVASAGMAASFALWGPSTFDPIRFAAGRSPVLSIYDVLGSPDSPLRLGLKFDLASIEKPLILAAEAALLAWCWWRKAGPAVSALLVVLAVLLFYRSGYNNYQMMAFCLLAYLFAAAQDELHITRGLLLALCAYLGALAAIDAGYPVVRRIASTDHALLYLNGSYLLRWLAGCMLVAAIMATARAWPADTQPSTNRGPTPPRAPAESSLL